MCSGDVLLWLNGAIVWKGPVGAYLTDIRFDTVSLHVDDSALIARGYPDRPAPKSARRACRLVGLAELSSRPEIGRQCAPLQVASVLPQNPHYSPAVMLSPIGVVLATPGRNSNPHIRQ